jgi:hypothetical protein
MPLPAASQEFSRRLLPTGHAVRRQSVPRVLIAALHGDARSLIRGREDSSIVEGEAARRGSQIVMPERFSRR